MAAFTYDPLKRNPAEVRLFRILPAEVDAPIELKLEHQSRATVENDYIAVSYMWGIDEADKKILLNGNAFMVRSNLFNFLSHYRSTSQELFPLWMDAICINQDDLDEKAWQVAAMGDIFEQAHKVLIWLGDASKSEDIAAAWRQWTAAQSHFFEYGSRDGWDQQTSTDLAGKEKAARQKIASLARILGKSEYWERLWIMQEIIVARTAHVIVSSDRIDIESLQVLLGVDDDTSEASHFAASNVFLISRERSRNDVGTLVKLWRALRCCAKQKCKVPLDKIYGILSLAPELRDVPVLYGILPEELFVNVTLALERSFSTSQTQGSDYLSDRFWVLKQLLRTLDVTPSSMLTVLKDNVSISKVLSQRETKLPFEIVKCLYHEDQTCRTSSRDCLKELDKWDCAAGSSPSRKYSYPWKLNDLPQCYKETNEFEPDEYKSSTKTLAAMQFGRSLHESELVATYSLTDGLRICQCLPYKPSVDRSRSAASILTSDYLKTLSIAIESAKLITMKCSPADIVLLIEVWDQLSYDIEQKITESDLSILSDCQKLRDFLMSKFT